VAGTPRRMSILHLERGRGRIENACGFWGCSEEPLAYLGWGDGFARPALSTSLNSGILCSRRADSASTCLAASAARSARASGVTESGPVAASPLSICQPQRCRSTPWCGSCWRWREHHHALMDRPIEMSTERTSQSSPYTLPHHLCGRDILIESRHRCIDRPQGAQGNKALAESQPD
jgi:hypothetical protein